MLRQTYECAQKQKDKYMHRNTWKISKITINKEERKNEKHNPGKKISREETNRESHPMIDKTTRETERQTQERKKQDKVCVKKDRHKTDGRTHRQTDRREGGMARRGW